MISLSPVRLSELRTQANLLLKLIKGRISFSNSPLLNDHYPDLKNNADFKALCLPSAQAKLKDAYILLARQYGFDRWEDLRQEVINQDCLYRPSAAILVHRWFKSYPEARDFHLTHGGYLLRFWGDYVVCGEEYIRSLHLHIYKKEWKKAAYDWVKPADKSAWQALYNIAVSNYLKLNS